MAKGERRVKVPDPEGNIVDGIDVPIMESSEKWNEYTLEDGTVFRIKLSVLSAARELCAEVGDGVKG